MEVERLFKVEELGSKLEDAFNAAVVAAKESKAYFRHGAVLYKGRKHFKAAPNEYRTVYWAWRRPRKISRGEMGEMRLNNLHAEVHAMHNVSQKLISGSDIFVVRLNPQGILRNSKPCLDCERNMRMKGVRRCYFSLDEHSVGMIELC